MEEKLTFCKICSNHILHKRIGILCGITNKIPHFEKTCVDFKESKQLREQYEADLIKQFSNYRDENPFALNEQYIYYSYPTNTHRIFKMKSKLPSKKKVKDSIALNCLGISICMFLIIKAIMDFQSWPASNPIILLMLALAVLSAVIIALIRSILTNPTLAILDSEGVSLSKNYKIPWGDVLGIFIKREKKRSVKKGLAHYDNISKTYIVLKIIGRGRDEHIRISDNYIFPSRLLTTFEAYRQMAKSSINKQT